MTDSSSDETRPSKLSLGGKGNFIDQMRKANENVGRNRTTRLNAQPQQPARPPVGFDALPEYQRVMVQRKASEIIGVDNPFYRSHDEAAGATTTMDGEVYANFASYDYLGTNTDPRVTEAAKAAIDRFGISASASRLVAGERPVHAELEEKLASVYGVDAAVCFVSGYLTNVRQSAVSSAPRTSSSTTNSSTTARWPASSFPAPRGACSSTMTSIISRRCSTRSPAISGACS